LKQIEILTRIAARASTLSERLDGLFVMDDDAQVDEQIELRVAAWAKAIGKGDVSRLEQRLALDGMNLNSVRPFLGRVCLKGGTDLPPWIHLLPKLVAESSASSVSLDYLVEGIPNPEPNIDTGKPLPFEDIIIPWVKLGNRLLLEESGSTSIYDQLSDSALTGLSRYLLNRLVLISSRVFQYEFWQYRVKHKPILALLDMGGVTEQNDRSENELYLQYVTHILKDENLWAFFEEYSVLARLLVVEINTWVEVVGEFLTHLSADWEAIEDQFGETGTQIKQVKAGLSDPHNGGHTVLDITFEGGLQLIYKPHSLAMESAFQELVTWINDHGDLLPFKTLQLLDRGTHGWVKVIEQLPCETTDEVERYDTRLGMLICLMYLLNGTDFHYENIIAKGEYPVPVDLEMLMYPLIATDLDDALGDREISSDSYSTLFQSSILPFGDPRQQGGADMSFLGASVKTQTVTRRILKNVNSDTMHWAEEKVELDPAQNNSGVIFDDMLRWPQNYGGQILSGFRSTYQFLVENRTALLDDSSPLLSFDNLPTRFVFRATKIYFKVWFSSLEADCMREGIDRHIQLEHLGRAYIQEELGVQRYWKLFQEEVTALTQNDIPIFHMTTDSRDLTTPSGEIIPACFLTSGYQRALDTLGNLSTADFKRQRRFLRQSLYSKQLSIEIASAPTDVKGELIQIVQPDRPYSPNKFMETAVTAANQLIEMALLDDRCAFWTEISYDLFSESYFPRFLGDDLYSGNPGVALFLSAIWQKSGKNDYRDCALGALFGIRQRVKRGHLNSFLRLGIGGVSGIGSLIYALTRCAGFLDEETLLVDAGTLAGLITPELIAEDDKLDVIAGSAGAILGLLALYQETRADEILARATACGQHLLKNQVDAEVGGRAWPTISGKLIAGFSHGAAGIAYALLKLYEITADEVLRKAAQDAIFYEMNLFDPQEGNWPDLRIEEGFMTSWCHGAPGIALARLGSQSILLNDAIQNDINRGLDTTLKAVREAAIGPLDNLCCGHFGRADILITAGQLLGKDEYTQAALCLSSSLIEQAHQGGGYHLMQGLPRDLPQLGFFNGLAGIGYTCLRFARFDENPLPSVLLWE